jgi:hypothetical protein
MECKACGEDKPADDFYEGSKSKCKACVCEAVRLRRLTDPSVREYDRARAKLPHRREHSRRIAARWRKENPLGHQAQNAVSNAVRDGRLAKKPCEICGSDSSVHAHHKDYSKPLDVIWLCARCHHRLHALFPEIEGANKRRTP